MLQTLLKRSNMPPPSANSLVARLSALRDPKKERRPIAAGFFSARQHMNPKTPYPARALASLSDSATATKAPVEETNCGGYLSETGKPRDRDSGAGRTQSKSRIESMPRKMWLSSSKSWLTEESTLEGDPNF